MCQVHREPVTIPKSRLFRARGVSAGAAPSRTELGPSLVQAGVKESSALQALVYLNKTTNTPRFLVYHLHLKHKNQPDHLQINS